MNYRSSWLMMAVLLSLPTVWGQTNLTEKYGQFRPQVVQIESRYYLERAFLDLAESRMPPEQYRQFMREFGGALPTYGTGFFINDRGVIATNSHVVALVLDEVVVDNRRFRATLGDIYIVYEKDGKKQRTRAYVRSRHPSYDVAILTSALSGTNPVDFDFDDRPAVGERVLVPGYPMGIAPAELLQIIGTRRQSDYNRYPDMTLNSGHITALIRNRTDDELLMQIDARVNPGNSGSPLLNSADQVVGIITYKIAQAEGLGYAIPVWLVRDYLESNFGDEPTTGEVVLRMEVHSSAAASAVAVAPPAILTAGSLPVPAPRMFVTAGKLDMGRWEGLTIRIYPLDDYARLAESPNESIAQLTSDKMAGMIRWPLQYYVVEAVNAGTRKAQIEPRRISLQISGGGGEVKAQALGKVTSLSALPESWRTLFEPPTLKPGEQAQFIVCADAAAAPVKIEFIVIALDSKTNLTLHPHESN